MCIGYGSIENFTNLDIYQRHADGSIDELYTIHLTLLAHLFQVKTFKILIF